VGKNEFGMPRLEIAHKSLEARDGTTLRYFDSGGEGPPLVLANGLGGPLSAWKHQIQHLRSRYRVLSWDYRGLYGSSLPPGNDPDLSIRAHVGDLLSVLDAAGVEKAALVGWSMGVQVALELYADHPDRVTHLALLNGTFGKPLHGVGVPFARYFLPHAVDRARRMHHVGNAILQRASRWPETGPWLKRLGVISKTLDSDLFAEMVTDFGSLDLELYFTMLGVLGKHDAAHVLPAIRVPTLVITGTRDMFTPPHVAEKMAQRIPQGELLIVRGATHYAACEYPELINLRIDKFLHEHGYGEPAFAAVG
jgi:pimeloyl-ACP methyl ester carboxylesterase